MKHQVSLPGIAVPTHTAPAPSLPGDDAGILPLQPSAQDAGSADAPQSNDRLSGQECGAVGKDIPDNARPQHAVAENIAHSAAQQATSAAAEGCETGSTVSDADKKISEAQPAPQPDTISTAAASSAPAEVDAPASAPARKHDAPPVPTAAQNSPDAESDDWPSMSDMLQSFFVFEPTTATPEPITVMGLDCARPRGYGGLTEEQRRLAARADVICAGRALLEEFSGQPLPASDIAPREDATENADGTQEAMKLKARLLPLTTPLAPLLTRLSQMRAAGERVLVLADGDPLLFGIGATLVRQLGQEAVQLLPAVSSLQQACARLSLPWHKVICLSLHGRDDLRPLNVACGKNAPLCILTDARMSPDVLARHLLDRGVDWFDAHVFERMGAPDETASHMSLAETAGREFGPACTLVLAPVAPARRPYLGLDADQLAVDRGLISKKPVRAAALALLRIEAGNVVWDIGSGSGAVALEASVLAHEGRVVAVERSAGRAMGIQENRRRFGAANVEVRLGQAPECLPSLPDPQRVFIGGGLSGDDGEDILGHVCHRLPVGGRLVASCVLLDSLSLCRRFFEDMGWPVEILQISAAEGKTLGGDVHLAAMNPVFLLAAQKPSSGPVSAMQD